MLMVGYAWPCECCNNGLIPQPCQFSIGNENTWSDSAFGTVELVSNVEDIEFDTGQTTYNKYNWIGDPEDPYDVFDEEFPEDPERAEDDPENENCRYIDLVIPHATGTQTVVYVLHTLAGASILDFDTATYTSAWGSFWLRYPYDGSEVYRYAFKNRPFATFKAYVMNQETGTVLDDNYDGLPVGALASSGFCGKTSGYKVRQGVTDVGVDLDGWVVAPGGIDRLYQPKSYENLEGFNANRGVWKNTSYRTEYLSNDPQPDATYNALQYPVFGANMSYVDVDNGNQNFLSYSTPISGDAEIAPGFYISVSIPDYVPSGDYHYRANIDELCIGHYRARAYPNVVKSESGTTTLVGPQLTYDAGQNDILAGGAVQTGLFSKG